MARPAGFIGERLEVIIVTDKDGRVIAAFHMEFPILRFVNQVNTAELAARTEASLPAIRDEVLRAINDSDDPRMSEAAYVSVYIVPTDADTAKFLPWPNTGEHAMYDVDTTTRLALIRKAIIPKTIKIAQEENGSIQPLVTPTVGVKVVSTPIIVIPEPRSGIHDSNAEATTMVLIAVCGYYNDDPNEQIYTLTELDPYLGPFRSRYRGYSEEEFLDMYHGAIDQALSQAFGDRERFWEIQQRVTLTNVFFGEIPVADFPSVEGVPRHEVLRDSNKRFRVIHHIIPGNEPKST